MNLVLTHNYTDNNIFHFFLWDIVRHYHPSYENIKIYTHNGQLDKNNPCQKWRFFFLKLLCNDTEYIDTLPKGFKPSPIITPIYDHMNRIKYPKHQNYSYIYSKITSNYEGEYILLNQRYDDNRTLYDNTTGLLIEKCLDNKLELPLKVCDFGTMSPQEQYNICSKAKIFISMHGAGCTNLVFTPFKTPLIEISFKTHWYCDPVCDEHFTGKISIHEKGPNCKLCTRPYYHKNDYHNLCYLLDKPYFEINPIRYSEGFKNRNPISKNRIYINSEELIQIIGKLLSV